MNESLDIDGADDDDSPVDDNDKKATILKHFSKAMDGLKETSCGWSCAKLTSSSDKVHI